MELALTGFYARCIAIVTTLTITGGPAAAYLPLATACALYEVSVLTLNAARVHLVVLNPLFLGRECFTHRYCDTTPGKFLAQRVLISTQLRAVAKSVHRTSHLISVMIPSRVVQRYIAFTVIYFWESTSGVDA
jgi:hypothetical protein